MGMCIDKAGKRSSFGIDHLRIARCFSIRHLLQPFDLAIANEHSAVTNDREVHISRPHAVVADQPA